MIIICPPTSSSAVSLILVFANLAGCAFDPTGNLEPEKYPFVSQEVMNLGSEVACADLDGDGRDEILEWGPMSAMPGSSRLVMKSNENKIVEQINFVGVIDRPQFVDLEPDGVLEIAVPHLRNDSLFISFLSSRGARLLTLFLISGEPRREKDVVLSWDPRIQAMRILDIDNDSRMELVTVVNTGYARHPRGVLIHSLPEGAALGHKFVGSFLSRVLWGDFDSDGTLELVAATTATNNGAEAGGFSDHKSCLIVFKLHSSPEITWFREMGATWSSPILFHADFDGDGSKEFLTFTCTESARPEQARLTLMQTCDWKTIRERIFPERLASPQLIDVDRDTQPEILAIRNTNELWLIDSSLDLVQRRRFQNCLTDLHVYPDWDGDGIDELLANTPDACFLFSPDLRPEAVFPDMHVVGVMRRGIGRPAYFLARVHGQVKAVRLVKNELYLWHRHKAMLLSWLFIVCAASTILALLWLKKKNNEMQHLQKLMMDDDPRALVVLDAEGRIAKANGHFLQLFQCNGKADHTQRQLRAIAGTQKLVALLQEARSKPDQRHEAEFELENGGRQRWKASAQPISLNGNGRLHWLITVSPPAVPAECQQVQVWSLMSQRVAHELKNALTGILLSLERLEVGHGRSSNQNDQVRRITERIDGLRKSAHSFMKLVNVEQLNKTETDFNTFVATVGDKFMCNLPPDINCEIRLCDEHPRLAIDREQMQVVMENLFSNAINAMRDGGKVRVTTYIEKELRLRSMLDEPAEFLVLEVLDTGIGISMEDMCRIFEPRFTTSENGSGLGLAIVKKIVSDHGGHVTVESDKGKGAVFSIYLPMLQKDDMQVC